MGQVILIEPSTETRSELKKLLGKVAPSAELFVFATVEEFIKIFKATVSPAAPSESKESKEEAELFEAPDEPETPEIILQFSQVQLILVDREESEKVDFTLWKKLNDYIDQKKAALEEADRFPTRLILLDHPEFGKLIDARKYPFKDLFNVFMKPIDHVLVQQLLQIALSKEEALQPEDLYTQEADEFIEMIKDIQMEAVTELGFRTKSTRMIDINSKARYFGEPFEDKQGDSVFAYCYAVNESADQPGEYICSFSFFGIPNDKMSSLRRKIFDSKQKKNVPLYDKVEGNSLSQSVMILSQDRGLTDHFSKLISERFKRVSVIHFSSMRALSQRVSPETLSSLEEPVELGEKEDLWSYRFVLSKDKKQFSQIEVKEKADVEVWETGRSFLKVNESEFLGPVDQLFNWFRAHGVDPAVLQAVLSGSSVSEAVVIQQEQVSKHFIVKKETFALREVKEDPEAAPTEYTALVFVPANPKQVYEAEKSLKPVMHPIEVVLVDANKFDKNYLKYLKRFVAALNGETDNPPKYILVEGNNKHDYSWLLQRMDFDDVLHDPPDPFYVTRKIKMYMPHFQVKNEDDRNRDLIEESVLINTGRMVRVVSLSEVHVSIEYRRALQPGEMRRFILWVPNLRNMPEIVGLCRHSEKLDKDLYRCDFLFFGVQEPQLVYIRQWIKEYYIASKQAEEES